MPHLRDLLAYDTRTRVGAAKALGRLGEPQWTEAVRGGPQDFKRLASLGPPAVRPLLLGLDHVERGFADEVVRSVGMMLGVIGVEPSKEPTATRVQAAAEVSRLDAPSCDVLIGMLCDKDSEVRTVARRILGIIKATAFDERLVAAFGYAPPDVRVELARVLYERGEQEWRELVRGEADDILRVASMNCRAADEAVRNAVLRADWQEKGWALRSLASEGKDRAWALEVASLALDDPDKYVRSMALKTLAALGDQRGLDYLKECAKERVKGLIEKLRAPWREERMTAARELRLIAQEQPEMLRECWNHVRDMVRSYHEDRIIPEAPNEKDNIYSGHMDNGIGLSFPEAPPSG